MYALRKGHVCALEKKSTSFLPILSPNASIWKKLWRKFRKYLLISERHENTRFRFRSNAAMLMERKRQAQFYPSYIIHPYSMCSYYREILVFFVYFSTFILSPVTNTFLLNQSLVDKTSKIQLFNLCTDLLIIFNIPLCFISGYVENQTQHIVLNPKKIAAHYLKTYFCSDFVGALPLTYFMPQHVTHDYPQIQLLFLPKHLMLYPRVLTMLQYFRHLTLLLRVTDSQHEIMRMVTLTILVLHWCSCFLFAVQYVYYVLGAKSHSWMHQAQMHPELNSPNNTLVKKYFNCLFTAMSHFYRIGSKKFDTNCVGDYMALSGIMIFGAIYFAYIIVTVLQAVGTANASESKYEELMNQIYHYLRSNKIPPHTHLRLQTYYEHRFQKRYFREQSILSTLSEHLRYEIKLCTSRHLIGKVDIFKALSKSAIGSIIGDLTLEVYLSNDVIIQNETLIDSWYIISYGTVAIIHKSGIEITHLHDGECFGEISIVTGASDLNVVATEISEIFYMSKSDFLKYLSHESINKKIRDIIAEKQFKINLTLEKSKYCTQEREEILYKVGKGKILQKGYRRH